MSEKFGIDSGVRYERPPPPVRLGPMEHSVPGSTGGTVGGAPIGPNQGLTAGVSVVTKGQGDPVSPRTRATQLVQGLDPQDAMCQAHLTAGSQCSTKGPCLNG